jgi:hypothetical protein
VTLDAIATKLGIGRNAVQEMIGSLDYQKKGHPAARKCSASHCSFDLSKN